LKRKILHFFILASALISLFIRSLITDYRWLVYVVKPLTTMLILLLALVSASAANHRYRWSIVVGLFFSLAGDVFLMLPGNLFIAGLASFLVAHIFYLLAFTSDCPLFRAKSPFLLLIPGAVILLIIWPGVSSAMCWPVIFYLLMISAMTIQAVGRGLTLKNNSGWIAAAGALLFFVSDALLAVNRFGVKLPSSGLLVLGTYYPAQWLIASSVAVGKRLQRPDSTGSNNKRATRDVRPPMQGHPIN
jgi:uncharacterized membrane protein YhhN